MRDDGRSERIGVVSPFQTGDDPPAGKGRGHVAERPRHPAEALRRDPHAAERVLLVGVEARGDDEELRPEPLGEALERRDEPARVSGVA